MRQRDAQQCNKRAQRRRNRSHLEENERWREDYWLLDEAVLLPENTTVILRDVKIKLSDRCRDNFFRTANCGIGIDDVLPIKNVHIRGEGLCLKGLTIRAQRGMAQSFCTHPARIFPRIFVMQRDAINYVFLHSIC